MEKVTDFGRHPVTGHYFLQTDAGSEFHVTPHHGVGIHGFDGVQLPSLLDRLYMYWENGVLSIRVRHIQPDVSPERVIQLARIADSPAFQSWMARVNSLFL